MCRKRVTTNADSFLVMRAADPLEKTVEKRLTLAKTWTGNDIAVMRRQPLYL